jgi:hypothetical protein
LVSHQHHNTKASTNHQPIPPYTRSNTSLSLLLLDYISCIVAQRVLQWHLFACIERVFHPARATAPQRQSRGYLLVLADCSGY